MSRFSTPPAAPARLSTELLEHFRGQPAKLKYKYCEELHANEVAILPYYVANLNIEATYAALTGEYEEFPNLCFVDTLDNVGGLRKYAGHDGQSVRQRQRGKRRPHPAARTSAKSASIIGNPPYNANQLNENDNNKNREYPDIDQRIKQTYIADSTAQKTKLYDMYARFFRWASDRLDENGIIAFVTNRSFIDSRTFDGFRKIVARNLTIFTWSIWAAMCAPTRGSAAPNTMSSASRPAWPSAFWSKRGRTTGKRRIYYMCAAPTGNRAGKTGFPGQHQIRGR